MATFRRLAVQPPGNNESKALSPTTKQTVKMEDYDDDENSLSYWKKRCLKAEEIVSKYYELKSVSKTSLQRTESNAKRLSFMEEARNQTRIELMNTRKQLADTEQELDRVKRQLNDLKREGERSQERYTRTFECAMMLFDKHEDTRNRYEHLKRISSIPEPEAASNGKQIDEKTDTHQALVHSLRTELKEAHEKIEDLQEEKKQKELEVIETQRQLAESRLLLEENKEVLADTRRELEEQGKTIATMNESYAELFADRDQLTARYETCQALMQQLYADNTIMKRQSSFLLTSTDNSQLQDALVENERLHIQIEQLQTEYQLERQRDREQLEERIAVLEAEKLELSHAQSELKCKDLEILELQEKVKRLEARIAEASSSDDCGGIPPPPPPPPPPVGIPPPPPPPPPPPVASERRMKTLLERKPQDKLASTAETSEVDGATLKPRPSKDGLGGAPFGDVMAEIQKTLQLRKMSSKPVNCQPVNTADSDAPVVKASAAPPPVQHNFLDLLKPTTERHAGGGSENGTLKTSPVKRELPRSQTLGGGGTSTVVPVSPTMPTLPRGAGTRRVSVNQVPTTAPDSVISEAGNELNRILNTRRRMTDADLDTSNNK